MKLLSIIIPCYNAEPYIDELINRLVPQISDDIEVIVVDDGSKFPYLPAYPKVKVIRQENGGASAARNTGLNAARGEYIAFIDADDLVSENYIRLIRDKISEGCDYIWLSWKTIGKGWQANIILKSHNDSFPPDNLCVWNRIYRRSMIGSIRFNTAKLIAEDAEFIREVETAGYKKGIISEPIYLYRSDTPNSLCKRFASGELDTKRVVYYFKEVTPDMDHLINVFKEDDKTAEVILMTNNNQIPELKKYAMVIPPRRIMATEKKGEPCNMIKLIEPPEKTQVVIWTHFAQAIGGIETFTYYFSKQMSKYYDIIILYDTMDPSQILRVSQYVECRKNDPERVIECEYLIVNRIVDTIPDNIRAKKTIQMVHGAKIDYASVPQDRDIMVCVSEYVKKTWEEKAENAHVIHNIMGADKPKTKPLLLVTASRLEASDKGSPRMMELGQLMDRQGVSYIWLCFSNKKYTRNVPKGMLFMEPTLDIIPWIQKADYLVQLSDEEAFCYSLVESLDVKTAVIVTPLNILDEIGVIDGKNGYVVPFDITEDYDTTRFLNIPKFDYKFDNKTIIQKWRELLGDMKPTHSYKPGKNLVLIQADQDYRDVQLCRQIFKGEKLKVNRDRAEIIVNAGYAHYA